MTQEEAVHFADASIGEGCVQVVATPIQEWKPTRSASEWFEQVQDMPDPLFVATPSKKGTAGDGPWAPRAWIPNGKNLDGLLKDALYNRSATIREIQESIRKAGYDIAPAAGALKKALAAMGCTQTKVKGVSKWRR
jgi:hypothetical protein